MPSSNRTLFHPAPLEVSLSTLENLLPQEPAHSRPHLIYSCPITSVYRLHISKLNHRERLYRQGYSLHMPLSSHDNRLTNPMYSDEDSDEGSDEDNGPAPEPTQNLQHSTASSIYASRGPSRGHRIRTAVVNSTATNKVQLDPLALARLPPPWSVLDAHGPPGRQQQSHNSQDMLASIGDTGLTKRHVAGMQDMVTSLAAKNKGRKVEHELASTSALPSSVSKMRNPFLKSRTSNSNRPGSMMRSVFAEQKAAATPVAIARSGMKIAGSMPKFCDAGALKTVTHNPTSAPCSNTAASKPLPSKLPSTSNPHPPETSIPMVQKLSAKQLRPITSYPVPPCPIEHLLLVPQLSVKRKKGIQTGLAIPRSTHKDESDEDEESIMGDDSEAPPKRARRDRSFTNTGKKGKRQEKAITHPITSASPPYASNPHHVQSIQKPTAKPLRPITSYPVPPCPIEHLLRVPQLSMKKKKGIQTELPFPKSREHRDDSDDGGEDGVCNNSKGNEKPPKKVGMNRGTGVTNTGKKGKQKVTGFDWNRWRRTTI
ncbi:hypothetical protein K503DRAFT_194870 [Rhizopogon vinicolor AM-OR11-026]|uniref:Uncharacterized protein n=1 Tax=Rhizopogon vinicolor AM-OR11-026 TaxID=1314800 RepID=A0A1B7NI93_9AGAM|nr:hypothetical protein K503DRAFT_194870 [Rhizopogon vinicolor AM-OR11-026]